MEAPQIGLSRLVLVIGNILSFIVFVVLSIIYSTGKLNVHPTDIVKSHHTLVIPAYWSFYIWILILVLLGIFVVYQAVPTHRDSWLIFHQIGPFFILTNMAMFAWTFCFSYNALWASFAFMVIGLITLITIYVRVGVDYSVAGRARTDKFGVPISVSDFWILQTPFSVTLGWFIMMTICNLALAISASKHHVEWTPEGWSITFQLVSSLLL